MSRGASVLRSLFVARAKNPTVFDSLVCHSRWVALVASRNAVTLLEFAVIGLLVPIAVLAQPSSFQQNIPAKGCAHAAVGSSIESPPEIRSRHGVLRVNLTLRNWLDSDGNTHFCYSDQDGHRSPTLRVNPGDLIVLKLKNELSLSVPAERSKLGTISGCKSMPMDPSVTNLHFHGLSVAPSCHADDSLHTSISSSGKAFEYRFRISAHQPPGLYWYHPHVHGYSEEQVLGGASGALIVEGVANANSAVAGLPERIIVIRDQKLGSTVPQGDGHDLNRPARDLSINFIPIPYPDYPVSVIRMRPRAREFWRVLNASADTYLNLAVLFNGEWQKSKFVAVHPSWQRLGLVALDGVPISDNDSSADKIAWKTEIPIPPGGRAEFVFRAPADGVRAELLTTGVDTTPPQDDDRIAAPQTRSGGLVVDNDDATPPRPLARIVASEDTMQPPALRTLHGALNNNNQPPLVSISPVRSRKLYFSEDIQDPKHPDTSTSFYITEEGRVPQKFDPSVSAPNITVHEGDVEDWTIENRSLESHVFHIHQIHFLLLERNGETADGSYLLDTVDVPYWDGSAAKFPSVKLRMDFRNPEIVGTFPYHCHILQHADGGMMGLIEVLPSAASSSR